MPEHEPGHAVQDAAGPGELTVTVITGGLFDWAFLAAPAAAALASRSLTLPCSAMRVEVYFTDSDGRRWKVYDWSLICGHKYRRSPGEQCAECRGFLDDRGEEACRCRAAPKAGSTGERWRPPGLVSSVPASISVTG